MTLALQRAAAVSPKKLSSAASRSRHSGAATPVRPSANPLLRLQQSIGNRGVQRLLDRGLVQATPAGNQLRGRSTLPAIGNTPKQVALEEGDGSDSSDSIKSVKVWLNAFIPKHISGLTKPAPNHKDKTMIPGPSLWGDPWVSDCFLTDQRSFDSNVKAASRMHSEIEIDIGGPSQNFQWHDCSPTHEIDCGDGDIECTKKGDTSKMKYSNLRGSLLTVIKVDLKAASNNPCYSGSPDIDYEGTVTINPAARTVDFAGKLDAFPAFEMYATANGGAGKTMFREPPPEGNSPGDLAGGANREITGHTKI